EGNGVIADNEVIWKKDGSLIDVEYKAHPYKVKNKVVGTVVSFTNITKRQEREQRRDEFLSIASHELKTPITTIKAFTQLLMRHYKQESNDKARIYLSKMDVQLDKLTALVQDLLDVSKIQAGKLIYNEEVFRLQEVVEETIDDTKLTYPNHRVVFQGNT